MKFFINCYCIHREALAVRNKETMILGICNRKMNKSYKRLYCYPLTEREEYIIITLYILA